MVEILLLAFSIMYTPGPVNLLALNTGLNGQVSRSVGFCIGVGCAMGILFMLFGYTGAWLVSPGWQMPLSLLGASYMLWLAWKLASAAWRSGSQVDADDAGKTGLTMRFRSGLMVQLLNPKAPLAVLPIATVLFPAAQIEGSAILIWSLLLGTMAGGAPGSYMLAGARLGSFVRNPQIFRWVNTLMALLLIYVAGDIALQWLPESTVI